MARVVVPVTDITPPKASLTTALAGSNNDLVFTAVAKGPIGNAIRVQYVVAGNNTPLSVDLQGFDIIVNVATSGGGAATSTSGDISAAVAAASTLVSVANAGGDTGAGVVTAMSITSLAGGSLQVTPPSQVDGDTTNGHYFTGNDGYVFLEVVSSDGSSRNVTISYAPTANQVTSIAAQVEAIPAGLTRLLGPFPAGSFDQNLARDVYFIPSISTSLKFRAYRPVKG